MALWIRKWSSRSIIFVINGRKERMLISDTKHDIHAKVNQSQIFVVFYFRIFIKSSFIVSLDEALGTVLLGIVRTCLNGSILRGL